MAFFASCSQEEIVSTNGGGDNKVRLSVNVSGAQPNTRATQSLAVEGYVMRCIAQAVNAEGKLIDGFSQTVSVSEGTAHFEFEAPEGVAKYIFWADYVSGNDHTASDNAFYNAADLTKVGYRLNQNAKLFNNQAADAFCASVAADEVTTGSVTLKRPFTRLVVRQSQVASMGLTGLTNIVPNINAGSGYNVATGEATTNTTVGLAEGETLTALTDDADFYFFCYAFAAPATQDAPTTIVFNDGSDTNQKTLSIAVEDMQNLTANNSVNLTPEDIEGDKISVDLEIDNGYDEPTLEVGSYIYADGTFGTNSENAVAVVFAMADGKTDTSDYGEGKTAAAYAISLNKAIANRLQLGITYDTDLQLAVTAVDYSGYTFTSAIQTAMSSHTATNYPAFNAFFNANQLDELTGDNLSNWYIPSITQLEDALAYSANDETLKGNLQAAYTGNYYLASSSVVESNLVRGIIYNIADGTYGAAQNIANSGSAYIFAVVTIFE